MAGGPVQIAGYELLRQLGVGGMSTVWLGLQQSLDRKVAIKIMRRVSDTSPDDARQFEKRFLLEGRTMARLPHRNIVAVYDIVSTDEVAYIAMEYLEGGTLSEKMKEGLSLGEAVAVVIQIAGALDFSHSNGIVHRDLKPANIMFRDALTPVLTDFGIARQQDAQSTRLTQTGMLVGTPNYMSPEQISGGEIDGRSDLYSLGVMFYELLTGNTPFTGDTPIAVMMAHLTQPPPPLPEEFAHFQPIMDVLLAKNREDRFPTMHDFVLAVKQGVVGSDTLLTRLQIDPGLSTSEQLRKIGFSLSDPTGKSWRSLGGTGGGPLPRTGEMAPPRDPSQRVPAPRGPGVSARLPVQNAPPPPPPPPERSRWPLITALAAAALLAIGGGVVWKLRGGGGLDERERQLIQYWLADADRFVAEGKVFSPAKDNAIERLQQVEQLDPANEQAEAMLERIARAQQTQGENALKSGDFAAAAAAVQGGQVARPGDAALKSLGQRIEAAKGAAEKQRQVEQLLAGADAAQKSGHVFGADSTYSLLRKAQELVPQDAAVAKRLQAFVAEQLATVRKAMDEKNLPLATALLNELKPHIGNEPAFAELARQSEDATRAAEQERRLAAALQQAQGQLKAARLAEPAGDNAAESLQTLRELGAADPRVNAFAGELAAALVEDGKRSAAKEPQRALERADQALKAVPDLAAAVALKNDIESKLDQKQREVGRALSAAKQAINERRFLSPANDNARLALDNVLKLEPNNAEARGLLRDLPKRIVEAAETKAGSDADAALALAREGQGAYPADTALAQLVARLTTQVGKEKAAAQAKAARERIADLLAASPAGNDKLREATKELSRLLATEPRDAEALALRKRLAEAFGENLQAADSPAELDAVVAVAKEASDLLNQEPAYLALPGNYKTRKAKLVEAEQARIAASQGELVFNAQPWATVQSVLDSNGKPLALPPDATTPFVLTLPAGNYTVTFTHPKTRQPVRQLAKVEAKQRNLVNARFGTLTAEDYFTRAGW